MNLAKYIKMCCIKKEITLSEVAEKTKQSRQNLFNKFHRNDFKTSDLQKIAEILNCDLSISFIDKETGKPLI